MLYAGLDMHKNFCQTIVCTEDGVVIKQGKLPATTEEIGNFFSGLSDVKIAVEATTCYEYVFDFLEGKGYTVVLSHPLKTRMIAESRIKTDKIDARVLADLLRANLLPTSYVPPKNIRELRHLVRRRVFLGRLRGRLKNRIHAELIRRGLRYDDGDLFVKDGVQWLHSLNIPAVESYLVAMGPINVEIRALEKEIRSEGLKYKEVRHLVTVYGIGFYSAVIIFSEIGDVNRFRSEEKLFSYAGLIPSVRQSGEHKYHGSITKVGSKHLRWILVEAVRVHLRHNPDSKLTLYYKRLRRKKPDNVAVIATARKLLQIIYHMLKNDKDYRG